MDNIKIEDKLKKLILTGKFLETKYFLNKISKDIFEKIIFEIGCDEDSICAYSFICFLIKNHETIELNCLASRLLNIAFPHLEGSCQTSLYHMKRAIELDSSDISLKESLLYFNAIPEKLISDEEAKDIANNIILEDPDSEIAKFTLDSLNNF
jgi:hypothetical protein